MADKTKSSYLDSFMKQYLLGRQEEAQQEKLLMDIAAKKAADPFYNENRQPIGDVHTPKFDQAMQAVTDSLSVQQGRDLEEHLQDAGAGLMGTLGAMGSTADLATQVIADSLANLGSWAVDPESQNTWERTQGALDRMNTTRDYWRDLESEKSKAFDRVQQYRQDRAVAQANDEAFAETGGLADPIDRMLAEFDAAAGGYLDAPGQAVTDSIAQLPYLLTGGVAKAVTKSGQIASPLIARLAAGGMGLQSARKLVQMGLVGGMQGTIEGADAAAGAYARVMESTKTFTPQQEAEREIAALEAAATAFGISAPVSAITGGLASKFELAPFSAVGRSAAARTGDNLVKALQEGLQETIESGTSQFASNYAGNEVLKPGDQVFLDQGVGGAAGTGLVVGAGSTVVTNPRSMLDAAVTPLTLAGNGVTYLGKRAAEKERRDDTAAAGSVVNDLFKAAEASPVVAQAIQQAAPEPTITTDTPAEMVEFPEEIDTTSPLHLFATGMEYLNGKDMDSEDAVMAFHVLGAVLESAVVARNVRESLRNASQDESVPAAERESARKELARMETLVDDAKLNAWVEEMPLDQIDGYLDQLKANPAEFGSTVAHLAQYNPMKVSSKMLEAAYESQSLTPIQRDSIALAQELKQAEDELRVGAAPDSVSVTRSIMQTGFPGASDKKQSIADMVRNVTASLAQGDKEAGQIYFNKLASFSKYLSNRATRFEQAKTALAADPDARYVDVPQTGTWDRTTGKYNKNTPFRLNATAGSLDVVRAVRRDADTVAKMVTTLQQRTGLVLGGQQAALQVDPLEASQKAAEASAPVEATPAAQSVSEALDEAADTPVEAAEPAPVETGLESVSTEELNTRLGEVVDRFQKGRSRIGDQALLQDLTTELDRRQGTKSSAEKIADRGTPGQPPLTREDVADGLGPSSDRPFTDHVPDGAITLPSRNHLSSQLMPDYPVAEGASVAEQNDAKNHLAQSFTTSQRPGLLSKTLEVLGSAAGLIEDLQLTGRYARDAAGVFAFKESIRARLNQKLAGKYPRGKRKAMLGDQNFWKEANAHSLYAAEWDENGIRYNESVGQVMAWTGVQHLLDLVNPVSWSEEKKHSFVATYGEDILPLLDAGWVPLADQVHQVAQKLQTNLELTPDAKVSAEYTKGTMLALAMDTLGVMITEPGYDGPLVLDRMTTLEGVKVNWIRVGTSQDTLHDAARAMEGFFPERSAIAAGIVGKKPEKVNTRYRGSRQKVGKAQEKALLKMSQTEHKLSPLMLKLWDSLPNELGARLFGFKPVRIVEDGGKPQSLAEIAQHGANVTLMSDLKTIGAHIRAVREYAAQQEEGTSLFTIPSYFEYEMVVNGRAMTKGTSPQSSKLYRELFSTVQREINPRQLNTGFMMAVAQGFGIKMDKQPVKTSLDQLTHMLADSKVQAAIEAMDRLMQGDLSQAEGDIATIEQSGIELTPHAISALVHMAEYKKGKPFMSSLSYEIDGLTDGPINLMMLMGLKGSAAQMEHWLGLGGLWFGNAKIAVQDKLDQLKTWFKGSKDLYEIIADRASEMNNEQARRILASVPKDQKAKTELMLKAILHLMQITKLSQSNLQELTAKHSRSFTKKPTQAAGYQQGIGSIVNDLTNNLTEALSQRIDAGLMTDGDWAAVDVLFGSKLVYSKTKKQYFLIENPTEFDGLKWDGTPLNQAQFNGLALTLTQFGGHGLANATMDTIGYQRNHMSAAVELVNAHIKFAQESLEKAYKAKQAEEVAAGRLHPNQALSLKDEEALVKDVWERIIPHPVLRNTEGLPVSSTSRTGMPRQMTRAVESALFQPDRSNQKRDKDRDQVQYLQVSEAAFEDPGVSFAALSIMAAGDGSMMAGYYANNEGEALNMFDGIYIDPADIDKVGFAINREVKKNWEHDYIGAVLDSLKLADPEFQAWAKAQVLNESGLTLLDELQGAAQMLKAQRINQINMLRDINSRQHWVSHMAGHNNPYGEDPVALESTTLGTTQTDPLLDLAVDSLGEVSNGIRRLSKADVTQLLNEHTFENPILSGLWKVLAPLLSNDLILFVSSDRQGLAEFYQQNERREMGVTVDGVAVGDRVYVRAINAETILHELLHHTTKDLTATYFSKPAALTAQQREAMKNLVELMNQFLSMELDQLPPMQKAMAEHARSVIAAYGSDTGSALQEFLAYGLSNYHLQRTLGTTKSTLGQLLESVFNAIKKLFGFHNGTQADSMLAQMFSNFEALASDAVGVLYPVSMETALESVNPELARSYGEVLQRMQNAAFAMPSKTEAELKRKYRTYIDSVKSINIARTRMQDLAQTGLFNFTNEQQSAAEYVQAMFAAGLQFKPDINGVLQRVVDAVRETGIEAWRTNDDPADTADIAQATARYQFFFESPSNKHDRAADILSLALVSPEFAERLGKLKLPRQAINKDSINATMDTAAKSLFDWFDTNLSIKADASLSDALEIVALRLRKSMLDSVKRMQAKPSVFQQVTGKLSQGVQWIGEKAGQTAEARFRETSNKDHIGTVLALVAGMTNDNYADMMGKTVLSLTNHMEKATAIRETLQEMVGTVGDNFKLIQLKGIAARMISAIRQSFREQVPETVKSWFNDLSEEQDSLMHKVIGQFALYSLSQGMKDRIEELLTDPSGALLDTQTLLMGSGNRTKRALMIKYAKHLGDQMAGKGMQAVYRNTRAVAGLAVHGGGDALSAAEMAALEDLSTLQALTHLTKVERQMALDLVRSQKDAFWKTTALIHAFQQFDTRRAGQDTATLNFQKGWIPVEADGRKKVKLFAKSEVGKAERMGWVKVAEHATEPNMVYMATTVGKTPTLSGGAIHSVDYHMNGIHYQSGLPVLPGIQTVITHPKYMQEIKDRINNGEFMPYTALYDASGDVVGFQRILDPQIVAQHTRDVRRISDAAGIWLGRLYEEKVAHGQNQLAVDLLAQTWNEAPADRKVEFVNIRDPKDKVLHNVWKSLPYHTKVQLETAFSDGSQNPAIWIRRDQLNDAVGYHKASVGNFFTGDNRLTTVTNENTAALARQFLGKNAYKYLLMAEEGWQGLVASAKDTIIVKSLVVALGNIASNQTQMFMITGNPVWNARVQAQKFKEITLYLGYQKRLAQLRTEELVAGGNKDRITAEKIQLKKAMRALSIHPLIEAGEMPTIAEGLSETEEFSLVGDFTDWVEKQVGKLPPMVGTIVDNLAITKNTSLYKGLDRMVQYGDFVAKATMYEWMTTQQGKSHDEALKEVNDEFVNYARLPGRLRTYGEDMGLLWFYNYKLRIMKIIFRRMRQNPAAFLIGAQVGGMLGVDTLVGNLPWNVNLDYATGIDPLFSAHQSIMWNQLF